MKKCSQKNCIHKGKLQPLSNFYKDTRLKDNLKSYCKDCCKIYERRRSKRTINSFYIKNTKFDKRIKLTEKDKEEIFKLRKEGYSLRELAKLFDVSKRLIQFVLNPLKKIENIKRRQERGGSKQYYEKEKHRVSQKRHRRYKKELYIKGKIKLKTEVKMNYKNKAEYLFKQIFGKRYINSEEQISKKTKKGNLYIYGGDLVLQVNDGGGIHSITNIKNDRELYIYACGLYDMKMKKIQDFIKSIK